MSRARGSKNKPKTPPQNGEDINQTSETSNQKQIGAPEIITPVEEIKPPPVEPETTTTTSGEPEIDIWSTEIPIIRNPLDAEFVTKPYTDLPNPDGVKTETKTDAPKDGKPEPPKEFKESTAPSLAVAVEAKTPEEIKSQAAQTVKLFWSAYSKLKSVLRFLGKIPEDQLVTEHLKGELDLDEELPIGKKGVRLRDFITELNTQIDAKVVTSKEVIDSLTPSMIRVCIKRGWLVSDELYIGSVLIDDLSMSIGVIWGLKKSANMILDNCRETLKVKKEALEVQKQILANQNNPQQRTQQQPHAQQNKTNGVNKEWVESATEETKEASVEVVPS